MQRLFAWWQEFWALVNPVVEGSQKVGKFAGIVFALVPAVLGIGSLASDRLEVIRPWAGWLLAATSLVVVWLAAVAWERTRGPIVLPDAEMRFELFTKSDGIFEWRICNAGNVEVVARVYAAKLEDRDGNRIGRIDEPIELHWRGLPKGQSKKLFQNADGIAGVLWVAPDTMMGSHLFLWPPTESPRAPTEWPLFTSPIIHLREQKTYLTLRVVFRDEKDERTLIVRDFRFSIEPDATLAEKFRIRRA